MDPLRFDRLTRSLFGIRTRRGLVRLAALPLSVPLTTLLGAAPETAAKKGNNQQHDDDHGSSHRRRRRRARHRHQNGDDKKNRKKNRKGKGKGKGKKRCTKRTCPAGNCGSLPDGCGGTLTCGGCGGNQLCVDGTCQPCTVICGSQDPADCGSQLQDLLDLGGTVYACPGEYAGNFTMSLADVTLIGAGKGDDPQRDTILDAQNSGTVVSIGSGRTVTLRSLHITGGNTLPHGGGVLHQGATLTMTDCSLVGNRALNGAGLSNRGNSSIMTRCVIQENETFPELHGQGDGGGLFNGSQISLRDCLVTKNTASSDGGGIYNLGTLMLYDTVVGPDNESAEEGGGIFNLGGTVTLDDGSLVCGNRLDQCAGFNDPACQDTCPA